MVGVAGATHLSCGDVITSNTTLDSDIGPCPNNGLIIDANHVTLNLNGFRIFGTPSTGDGAGVLVAHQEDVRVTRGRITDFDAGVIYQDSNNGLVDHLTVSNNVGSSLTDFGDGIAFSSSNGGTIRDNTVTFNGPYDGVGLFNSSKNNLIEFNTITDNAFTRATGSHGETTMEDDGVRIEPGSNSNTVDNNTILRSGLEGVGVFAGTHNNVVTNNTISDNGFVDVTMVCCRPGSGIRVFLGANNTTISGNSAIHNGANGIQIDSKDNDILGNSAFLNTLFDLRDTNPNCDNNDWSGNLFGTANPISCIS